MKTIYIAVPYASNPKRGIELSIKYGQMVARQGDVPICPVLLFDPIFTCEDLCEKTHREFILKCCIELLNKCDEAIFITIDGKLSKGQTEELRHCLMSGDWKGQSVKWQAEVQNMKKEIKPKDELLCIAFDSQGNKWETIKSMNVLKKFNKLGMLLGTFTTASEPHGVAVDKSDKVWVVNKSSYTLSLFNNEGWCLGTFTTRKEPVAIAIDSSDIIYVSYKDSDVIDKYNTKGTLIGTLNSELK